MRVISAKCGLHAVNLEFSTRNEEGISVHIIVSNLTGVYGPGSSAGIATDYGLDVPEIESRLGEIFHPSRPAVGPTQPPVQWVLCLSRG